MGLLELVLLAHVYDDSAVRARLDQGVDIARVHLFDPLFDLADELRAAGHLPETPQSGSGFTSLSVARYFEAL
jgi:hypothetical protein